MCCHDWISAKDALQQLRGATDDISNPSHSAHVLVQRHDDVSQKSVSNSDTPKWDSMGDEPMDFSQPAFADSAPRQNAGRPEHAVHRVRQPILVLFAV